MKKFIVFELKKFFRQKGVYIVIAAGVALLLLNLWTYDLMYNMAGTEFSAEDMMMGLMPELSAQYGMQGALSNANFGTILAVLIALYVCADHSDGTLKNIIGHGYSRIKIFGSKYVVSIIGAVLSTVIYWVIGLVFGGIFWSFNGAFDGAFLKVFLVQIISVVAYTTLFFLVACVLKNIGGSLAVGIVIQMVPTLVFTLLDLFIEDKQFNFIDYWIEGGMAVTGSTESSDLTRIAIVSSVYAVIFLVLGLLAVRKREV